MKTCKLEFFEHCVIDKKTKVKFGTAIHCTERIFDYIHTDIWGPIKTASLGGITTLCRLLMIILDVVGCTSCNTRTKY